MYTREYRIFEVDKYGNKWFVTSFAGNPEIQQLNAQTWVKNRQVEGDDTIYEIVEV